MGPAAQYGSDAIAGAINFTLKADNHGGNVLVNTGLNQAGDGLNTTLSLNKGFKLGQQGFLNLTGEADYRGRTSRNPSRNFESHPIFSAASQALASGLSWRARLSPSLRRPPPTLFEPR